MIGGLREEIEYPYISDDFPFKNEERRIELIKMIQKTLQNLGYE